VCWLTVLCLLVLVAPGHVDGYIIPAEEPGSSVMAGQKAVIVHHDGREELIISAGLALDQTGQYLA